MRSFFVISLILLSGFFSSCITSKKLTYLQSEGEVSDTIRSVTPDAYKLQPFDNIYVRVVTPDPKWADMFNTIQNSAANSSMSEQSADLISYSVDIEGFIELPYAGKVAVAGKTLATVKKDVEAVLKPYVTDAAVIVKMINNYVTIIGEVRQPGKYLIYKDRMNIFQALGLASDLGEFSDRMKVQIIRQIPGGTTIKEFSLNDRELLASEYFYVLPNDVIYAKPVHGRFLKMDSFPYELILSAITTLILFLNVVK